MTENPPRTRTLTPPDEQPAPAASWQRRLLRHYVQVQVFWNPVLCAVAILSLGSLASFTRTFAVACVVAAVASSVSFLAVASVLAFEQYRRSRGHPIAHGRGFYLGVALLGMPVGLLLAAQVTELLFGEQAPGSAYDLSLRDLPRPAELVHEGDRRYVAVLTDPAATRVPVSRERLPALRAALGLD